MLTIVEHIDLINDIEKYDVILVGTNTYQTMGNGFQKKVRMKYPATYKLNLSTKYGDKIKLGTRSTTSIGSKPIFSLCFITNGYNFRPDISTDYLDYQALEKCLKTANNEFQGMNVATTFIGGSKWDGNGDRSKILGIIKQSCDKINLFIYDYEQIDAKVERTIQYKSIVNSDRTSAQKYEKILELIDEFSKLDTIDSPTNRSRRIKDYAKELLKK